MRLAIGVSVVVPLSCVVSQFKMLENSASRVLEKLGASNSGRQAVLDIRPFGTDGSGSDDPDKQREN